ncbi:hypothetical protein NKG05_20800 [Oerskovia sp. M15]
MTTVPSVSFLSLASPSGTARLILPNGTQKEFRGAIRAAADGAARGCAPSTSCPWRTTCVPSCRRVTVELARPRTRRSSGRRPYLRIPATGGNISRAWHTCDTTACQVYPGYRTYSAAGSLTTTHEAASTNAAVAATANQVRHYGGALAFTQFSSSSGGWTSAGSAPYLVAQPDPWDAVGNPVHLWSVKLSVQSIANAYPQVGVPRTIEVRTRSGNGEWGGRVESVTVTGSNGSTTLTGTGFRGAFGLRSDWWTLTASTRLDSDFTTNGRADVLAVTTSGALLAYEANGAGASARCVRSGTVGQPCGWRSRRTTSTATVSLISSRSMRAAPCGGIRGRRRWFRSEVQGRQQLARDQVARRAGRPHGRRQLRPPGRRLDGSHVVLPRQRRRHDQ